MSQDIRLETAGEFLQWANRQSKELRFKLADRNHYDRETNTHKTTYLLEVCGTGSTWGGNNYVYIPNDIGEPLSLEWKKSEWGRFIGMWGIKKILTTLFGSEKADDWKAIQATIEFKKNVRQQKIWAENALEKVERIEKLQKDIDGYLDDLDFRKLLPEDPTLADIKYTLVGYLEVTK